MIKVRRNKDDGDILELYTERNNAFMLWAIIHEDCLTELDMKREDIEAFDYVVRFEIPKS